MALTLLKEGATLGKVPMAPVFFDIIVLTFDTSYPAGGEALDLSDGSLLGSRTILAVTPLSPTLNGKIVGFDAVNGKVQLFELDYPAGVKGGVIEVPNASDQSGELVRLLVISE